MTVTEETMPAEGGEPPVVDEGPHPSSFDIERATLQNGNYRTVVWTGRHLQVTLMAIPVGQSIGLEVHPGTDQLLRIEAGHGRVTMGPSEEELSHRQDVSDGWSIQVPAGTWHDVVNIGEETLRLSTVYAPTHHAAGVRQSTKADAEHAEASGADEPPAWTAQPADGHPDQHA